MNYCDSNASWDNDGGVPDFENEEFMALSYSLVCERLGLHPGKSADESLEILQEYTQQYPESVDKINEAVDYGSKEAMVLWTHKVSLLLSSSCSSQ